ncbi:hypothetical protein GpartN1_g486.t1 [Galdieria partita]|uniref:Uncharacterized protein n=1 Tax=Galdieria partita TaxID=83374 RepID=A0A9C7UMF0_9RHOD|nr:hypothetical protein GpartN1_g486.t1 [Galdieria partita]
MLKKENEENSVGKELQSVWLLGILWTGAHMGPFLCTVIINSIIEDGDGILILSNLSKERDIVHILFYCYLSLSVLGFCCILILRAVDLTVRQQEMYRIEIIKWRIRFYLLAPFVLFLANSIELAIYIVLLVEDVAGNGYKLVGFWGCFLLTMSIIIFLVNIIMITSIFMAVAEAKRLKQALLKTGQNNNEQIMMNQVSWNQPHSINNHNYEWTLNSIRNPPRIAGMIQGNMSHSYDPSISTYQELAQIKRSDFLFWSRQSQGVNNRTMYEYQSSTEEYIPDPVRYL